MCELRGQKGEHTYTWVANVRMTNTGVGKFSVVNQWIKNALEANVTLDMYIGSLDVGTVQAHVHIGGPVLVSPFNIQTVVGLQLGRQRAVVTEVAFPFDRDISTVVDGRSNTVVGVKLLRDRDFLVVSRRSQPDVGLVKLVVDGDFLVVGRSRQLEVGVVHSVLDVDFLTISRGSKSDIGISVVIAENDVGFFGFNVVPRVDGHSSTIDIESLGSLNTTNIEASSSRCGQAQGEIGVLVIGIKGEVGIAAILSVDVGTSRNTPPSDVGAGLSPEITRKGCNIGGCTDGRFDAVVKSNIAGFAGSFPVQGGVQAVETIKVSISYRDLMIRELCHSQWLFAGSSVINKYSNSPKVEGVQRQQSQLRQQRQEGSISFYIFVFVGDESWTTMDSNCERARSDRRACRIFFLNNGSVSHLLA